MVWEGRSREASPYPDTLREQIQFELCGWYVAVRRVLAFAVVEVLQEFMDGDARLSRNPVFVAMHLFVLQGFHE